MTQEIPDRKARGPAGMKMFTADVKLWYMVEGIADIVVEASDEAEAICIICECLDQYGEKVPGVVRSLYSQDGGQPWMNWDSQFVLYRGHLEEASDGTYEEQIGTFLLEPPAV